MVGIQSKVLPRIKNRIRLLCNDRQISESELLREVVEDYLNGTGRPNESRQSQQFDIQLSQLSEEIQQLRRCISVMFEVILTNLTEQPDEVPDFLQDLREKNLI